MISPASRPAEASGHSEEVINTMSFRATILTLYPEMFPGHLGVSLAGKAMERGQWSLDTVQIRDFATDKHRTVDDTPAGGGAGMVLKPGRACPRHRPCHRE